MKRNVGLVLAVLVLVSGCGREAPPPHAVPPPLVGAWHSKIQFSSGAFASIRDLEFFYVFNQGGTMTESSNYDGAPPVPPAYGVWREIAPNVFETRYEFFVTKAPDRASELSGGWLPAGRGVFTERITLAADGRSFDSAMQYEAIDLSGRSAPGGGQATGHGTRMAFDSDSTIAAPATPDSSR